MQFFHSLLNILHPSILLVMVIGSIGGIIIGAMPGLTSVMGVTLLLPFTYGMDTTTGIAMLLAISFGAIYGGSSPSEEKAAAHLESRPPPPGSAGRSVRSCSP